LCAYRVRSSRRASATGNITRIALAFEAGRDGFWLARWLSARGVETHVIHPSSVAVSREHRRAKTDRLDTELLKRGFLGWLRGERGHCSMARIPTIAEEDAKRPNRKRECLVGQRTRIMNRIRASLARLGIRNFKPTLRRRRSVLPRCTPRRVCRCRQISRAAARHAQPRNRLERRGFKQRAPAVLSFQDAARAVARHHPRGHRANPIGRRSQYHLDRSLSASEWQLSRLCSNLAAARMGRQLS
jgi:transposase